MKQFQIIILIILLFQIKIVSQEICEECSQNLGSGFRIEKLDNTKNEQLISSAVGNIASESISALDGSKLISGFMPVCVLPMINPSSIIDTCSEYQVDLVSNSYLTDYITWLENGLTTNTQFYYKTLELPYVFNKINNTNSPDLNTLTVYSKKGEIYSETSEININIYPVPIVKINGNITNFCIGSTIVLSAFDEKDSNSIESNFIWTYNLGLGNFISTGKTISIPTNINTNVVNITLELKNDFTNIVSCASSNSNFVLSAIAPIAKSNLVVENVGKINPSEFENQTLQIKLGILDSLDYNNAINLCPPDEFSAEIIYYQKHFNPILNNSNMNLVKDYPINNYNTIYINKLLIKDLSKGELFDLEGYPLLGDLLSSNVIIRNIKLHSSAINDNTYNVIQTTKPLEFEVCEIGGERLIYKNISANIYPNPNYDSKTNIQINMKDSSDEFLMKIINGFGEILYQKAIIFNNGYNSLNLPENMISGQYIVILTNKEQILHLPLTILR
jgi:hypothetical protein